MPAKSFREASAQVLPNQNVQVWAGDELLREFEVRRDPGEAMRVLARFNASRDGSGVPIEAWYDWRGQSVYGPHQEALLWEFLVPFVSYRELLAWLDQEGIHLRACRDIVTSNLATIVRLWQDSPAKRRPPFWRRLIEVGRFACWKVASGLAARAARSRGVKVALFSYDTLWKGHDFDRRLSAVYQGLREKKIKFIEIFPAFRPSVARNAWIRKRLSLYYPPLYRSGPAHERVYALAAVDGLEEKYFRRLLPLVEGWLTTDLRMIPPLAQLLKRAGIRRVLSIDDTWSTTPLLLAARECGLEVMALQHGYYSKYHQGILQEGISPACTLSFPRLWVWGEQSRDFLRQRSRAVARSEIEVGGYVRPLGQPRGPKARGAQFQVLYPYEFLADYKQSAQFVEAFLAKGYRVHFKARWDDPLDAQLTCLPREKLNIVYELDDALLAEIDVCAGSSTSFLHEMYFRGVPLWYLHARVDLYSNLVDDGMAARITLEELSDPTFDPYAHLIAPRQGERLYAPASVAERILAYTRELSP